MSITPIHIINKWHKLHELPLLYSLLSEICNSWRKTIYLAAHVVMDGSETLVTGDLAEGDAIDVNIECTKDVEGHHSLVILHIVATYHQHRPLHHRSHGRRRGWKKIQGRKMRKMKFSFIKYVENCLWPVWRIWLHLQRIIEVIDGSLYVRLEEFDLDI